MMKKFSKIFIILILLMVPDIVFGDEYNHIFMVEDFKINTNNTVYVSGYSFMSHMDNYGVDDKGVGNLRTRIIAYTDIWKDEYAEVSKCNDSSNCYVIETQNELEDGNQDTNQRDFWASRCVGQACTMEDEVKEYRINEGFTKSCDGLTKKVYLYDGKTATGSHCLYYNVGFWTYIELDKLAKKFGENDVKFKIIPYIDGAPYKGSSKEYSSLSVYEKYCSNNGGTECTAKNNVAGDYSLDISGLSDRVYFDALYVIARGEEKKQIEAYFKEGEEYKVLDFIEQAYYGKNTDFGFGGNTYDSLLLLASREEAANTGGYYGKYVIPDDSMTTGYYAFASYVKFSGELVLKTKLSVISLNCNTLVGNKPNSSDELIVNCGSSGDLNKCEQVNGVFGTIYIKSDNSCLKSGKEAKYHKKYIKSAKFGDSYYIPVTVTTDILFNQEAKFTFGSITPSVVHAGKGFSLENVMYDNKIIWSNAKSTIHNSPYYKYDAKKFVLSGDGCREDYGFVVQNVGNYYVVNRDGSLSHYTSLSDAAFSVIDMAVSNYIKTENIRNISFVSCDSNDASRCNINSPNKNVSGSWFPVTSNEIGDYKYNGTVFGKTINNSYKYNLADSYVQVSGDEPGKALYAKESEGKINELINTGQKFYIDFKWVYDAKWPFNLAESINPSFIEGMNWSLYGTCGVDVEDGYYTSASNDPGDLSLLYKYRSISLKSPFPKAGTDFSKIAINWRDWYKENNNVNRLSNTYSRDVLYKITVSKIDNNDKVSISDINKYTSHYGQLADFEKTGESKFVIDNFETRANVRSYCGLGFFSTDCDELWG